MVRIYYKIKLMILEYIAKKMMIRDIKKKNKYNKCLYD